MSESRFNPLSIAKKNGAPMPTTMPQGSSYGYEVYVSIEPNPVKLIELKAMAEEAKLTGHEPPAVHLTEADMDYVCYHRPWRADPTGILATSGQPQLRKVTIQEREFFRMPLAELNARVEQHLNGGPADAKG